MCYGTGFSPARLIKMTPRLEVLPEDLSLQGSERRVRVEARTNLHWEELRNRRMEKEKGTKCKRVGDDKGTERRWHIFCKLN